MRNIHDSYSREFNFRLDVLRQRKGREPSREESDRISDQVWARVTGAGSILVTPHRCVDCPEADVNQ